MIKECAINIECNMVDSRELDTTDLIIGEIAGIYCEEECLSGGKPDYRKIDPMMFFMPDGPYFRVGDFLAKAFEVGKDYSGQR
jgi:flavin reductase (DIM6/NTAB) family NADH-FMN oxidoreductase RutF